MKPYIMLSNMRPDTLEHPLVVMSRTELFDEFTALEDMLVAHLPMPRREPDLFFEEGAWDLVMTRLLEQVPPDATAVSGIPLRRWPRSAGSSALRWRIGQARSLVAGRLPHGTADDPPANVLPSHEALLPMRLQARLSLVLGYGDLPMVWLRALRLPGRTPSRQRLERPS